MNKIILIGCPGSGKSTLAKKLGVLLDLPVHHLDTYYWKENWENVPMEEFNKKVNEVLKGEKWIVDGNFTRSIEERVKAADTVIVFDLPKRITFWRTFKRYLLNFNKVRDDMGGNNKERLNLGHLKFILKFPRERMFKNVYDNLGEKELIILKNQKDIDKLLNSSISPTMNEKKIWSKIHDSYSAQDWIHKPSLFAQSVSQYFPRTGSLLEIGGGLGQDSKYFKELGYDVLLTDISEEAISKSAMVKTQVVDVSKSLPFDDESFDIIYAHLSLHYFDKETTKKVFAEIRRVLKKGGVLAALFNSHTDPEYGTGEKIEEDYFNINSLPKRFLDVKSVLEFGERFTVVLVDDKGESYKDNAKGVKNLIRFVGKKS